MVVMSQRKVPLFIEDDKQAGEGDEAAKDLRVYLAGGLLLPPGYQGIVCIPVATVAGCDLKFGLCNVQGNVSDLEDLIAFWTLAIIVASAFVYLSAGVFDDQWHHSQHAWRSHQSGGSLAPRLPHHDEAERFGAS